MKRWNICDMVEARIFGFVRKKDNEKFEPLDPVLTITRSLEEDSDCVLLKSMHHEARFREEYFQPALRLFKGAILYLGATPPNNETGLGHLLFFDLGQGYYAVMTPFMLDEERKRLIKEAKS
jgi:hypothetical protein